MTWSVRFTRMNLFRPSTFSPQGKPSQASYVWRFPRPLKLWKKWSLPRQRWSWRKWSHGRMAYRQTMEEADDTPHRNLTWQSWKNRPYFTRRYIYIYTSSRLVVFFLVVMLNLQGGLCVWWYHLLCQSAVYKAGRAGKAALKLTACTWKWMVGRWHFLVGFGLFFGVSCWVIYFLCGKHKFS